MWDTDATTGPLTSWPLSADCSSLASSPEMAETAAKGHLPIAASSSAASTGRSGGASGR